MTLQAGNPASLVKRFFATAIDFSLMWVLLWMPTKLLFFGDIDTELEWTRSGIGSYFTVIRVLVLAIFPFCLRDIFGGRGLGKWLVGIRVADAADMTGVPSMRQLLLRNATNWVSWAGMAAANVHPDKMRFGDRLAGTMVVEDPPDALSSALSRRLFKGIVFVVVAACGVMTTVFGYSRLVRNSAVHLVSVEFITTYEPLVEVSGPIAADNVNLVMARYAATDNGAVALLMYGNKDLKRTVQVELLMERGLGDALDWDVKEASGLVNFLPEKEGAKPRVFAFLRGKDFARYLTEEEVKKIFEEKVPAIQVIPELKEADNATAPTTPAPAGTGPNRPAQGRPPAPAQ